jgi:SOS response regulatory protein OraA/RecX
MMTHRIKRILQKPGKTPKVLVVLETPDGPREVVLLQTVWAVLGIGEGDWITPEQLAEWESRNSLAACRTKSWDLLSLRPRSRAELEKALKRRFPPKDVQTVLQELQELGHLNDEQFAADYTGQLARRGAGRLLINQKLREKGLPEPLIETTVEAQEQELPEEQRAAEVLQRWLRLQKPPKTREDEMKLKSRAVQHLARKGFPYEPIRKAWVLADPKLELSDDDFPPVE